MKNKFDILKKFFKRKKPDSQDLSKLLSKEEFLRFKIIQQEISLRKAKTELTKFLKKGKK